MFFFKKNRKTCIFCIKCNKLIIISLLSDRVINNFYKYNKFKMSPFQVKTYEERNKWNEWSVIIAKHNSRANRNKYFRESKMDEWNTISKSLEQTRIDIVSNMVHDRECCEKEIQITIDLIAAEKRRVASEKRKSTKLAQLTTMPVRSSTRIRK